MHKDDKPRIAAYEKALAELKSIKTPGDIVEKKEGFLRKRVVARNFVFANKEDAERARRQAIEIMREIKTYTKRINDDMKAVRQMYKEAAGNVGSGSGFLGMFAGKQNVIRAKANAKREYNSERDARLEDYALVLREFEGLDYVCHAIKSDAEDFVSRDSN